MEQVQAAAEEHTEWRTLLVLLCGGPRGPIRAPSTRQLPTDHDHAASTREHQSDQPSRKPPRLLPDLLHLEAKPRQRTPVLLTSRSTSGVADRLVGVHHADA